MLRPTGRLDEAADCYANMVRIEPDHALAHKELGDVRLQMDRVEEARAAYDRALEVDPEYADAQLGRARIAARADDWEAVAREAEEVLRYRPNHADAMVVLGMAHAAGGRDGLALSCWKQATLADRCCRDAYQQTALLHALHCRADKAWQAVRSARYWSADLDDAFLHDLERATGRRAEEELAE